MRRRRLLAAGGLALLGVGCLDAPLPRDGRDAANGSTGTPTPIDESTPTGESTPAGEPTPTGEPTDGSNGTPSWSVSIGDAGVYLGVVVLDDDALSVVDGDGQYLLVETGTDGDEADGRDGPSADAFALAVGGEEYVHESPRSQLYWPEREPMGEFGDWLVFPLPETVDSADTRLTWPGGEWTPDDRIRDRLEASLPPFEVTLDAPESVGPDEEPSLSLSVRNVGDASGRCVLALNRVGPSIAYAPVRTIVVECEPGETVAREYDARSPHEATEPRPVTYHLRVANGERLSRTIDPAD